MNVPIAVNIAEWFSEITPKNYNRNEFYAVIFGIGGTRAVGATRNFDGKTGVEFRTFRVPFSHQIKVASKAEGIKEIQRYYGPTINTEDDIHKLLHETTPLDCSNLDNHLISKKRCRCLNDQKISWMPR